MNKIDAKQARNYYYPKYSMTLDIARATIKIKGNGTCQKLRAKSVQISLLDTAKHFDLTDKRQVNG